MPHDQSFKPHFFFSPFANALAFFRKQQRLPNGIQKCFSSFFRSEAVFDLHSYGGFAIRHNKTRTLYLCAFVVTKD